MLVMKYTQELLLIKCWALFHISEIKLFALKQENYSLKVNFSETPVFNHSRSH